MSSSNKSEKPELDGMIAYVLVWHIHCAPTDYVDNVTISGVYVDIRDAVSALKRQRLIWHDGWIPARNSDDRDDYPFRNKIGEIYTNDIIRPTFIGWGYSWADADSGETATIDRIYLEKTNIAHGNGELVQCLGMSREEVQVLEAESDIDFVAGNESHYFAEGARFDEKTKELIYSSEEEDDSHEVEPETRDNGTASVMDWMADMESSAFDRRIHML